MYTRVLYVYKRTKKLGVKISTDNEGRALAC